MKERELSLSSLVIQVIWTAIIPPEKEEEEEKRFEWEWVSNLTKCSHVVSQLEFMEKK